MNARAAPHVLLDWDWATAYVPAMRAIIGPRLLSEAPLTLDRREVTDLMILVARDLRIACRMRRPGFLNYLFDFTIRYSRDNGSKTELEKIMQGHGDWMFYGHAAESGDEIAAWMLLDLDAFRAHHIFARDIMRDARAIIPSPDGTTFAAYDVRKFPPDPRLLIAASSDIEEAMRKGKHENGANRSIWRGSQPAAT